MRSCLACLFALSLIGCASHQQQGAKAPKQAQQPRAAPQAAPKPQAPPATSQQALNRLRETVHTLSTEQWQEARQTGAEALRQLARAIDTSGGSRLASHVKELKAAANDVANAGALNYSDKMRSALTSAVDAIDALGDKGTQDWTNSARRAVKDISTRTPFELQRAAIQDAFRAVVDAYGVTSGAACTAKAGQ